MLGIKTTLVVLRHVDEEGEGFFLHNINRLEMTSNKLGQLSLVHARPRLQFVVVFVSTQSVNGHGKEVNLRLVKVIVRRLSLSLAILPLSLGSHVLNHILMVIANVYVAYTMVNIKLESALLYSFLDTFAVACVTSRAEASAVVVH